MGEVDRVIISSVWQLSFVAEQMFVQVIEIFWEASVSGHFLCALEVPEGEEVLTDQLEVRLKNVLVEFRVVSVTGFAILKE